MVQLQVQVQCWSAEPNQKWVWRAGGPRLAGPARGHLQCNCTGAVQGCRCSPGSFQCSTRPDLTGPDQTRLTRIEPTGPGTGEGPPRISSPSIHLPPKPI